MPESFPAADSFDAVLAFENSADSSSTCTEPDRISLKSFWVGWAGIALLTHAFVFLVVNLLSSRWFCSLLTSVSEAPFSRGAWDAEATLQIAMGWTLVPSLLCAAVTPLLYWRGQLILRFLLSIVLAIAVMNMSTAIGAYKRPLHLTTHFAVFACWISLPILFLVAPLRTKLLRGATLASILVLIICLSMLTLREAPSNSRFLFWQVLYGGVLLAGLLQRNWGSSAMLEKGSAPDQIERTSTRTLMELMLVCSLGCLASLYWASEINVGLAIHLGTALLLAIVSLFVSLCYFRFHSHIRGSWINWLGFYAGVWFLMSLVFAIATFGIAFYGLYWHSWASVMKTALNSTHFFIFGVSVSGFVFLLFNILLYRWLTYCGWRWATRN